jgi:hypothetical protein
MLLLLLLMLLMLQVHGSAAAVVSAVEHSFSNGHLTSVRKVPVHLVTK